jgi:diguanylate cyclase (GGDEF)-like protein/PAS domain S-box-containing protein
MPDSPIVILNVDDNIGARYAKTRVLKLAGFAVREAANGADALASVAESLPDLVLLDVKLPDINGLEVCRRIKENPATAAVLVLQTSAALTGRADRVRGLEGGADNYLAAPIEAEELVANVNALLRLRGVQRELRESEARFRQMAENIGDVFWIFSPDKSALLYVSPAYEPIWGRSIESLQQSFESWLDGVHPEDRVRVQTSFQQLLQEGVYEEEYRIVRPDGSSCWVRDRGFPVKNNADEVYRIARITSDISARKVAQERTLFLSRHDSLTGLPNRSTFHEELSRAIADAKENGTRVEVMFIDLDHFKEVNDSLGHHAGDALLTGVAQRLRDSVRQSDVVARLGGDEFGIIGISRDPRSNPLNLAEKLIAEMMRPFRIDRHDIVAGVSIGVTVYPDDGDDADTILRNADIAMYRAKTDGRSRYQAYTAELDAQVQRRRAIEEGLRHAMEHGELSLVYQPLVALETGEVYGVEALLRWKDAGVPQLFSSEIIHIADETGLIIPLGEWILNTACRQARAWREAGIGPLRVAVNVSSKQLKIPTFAQMVDKILEENGLPPSVLELEITEGLLMENNQANITTLRDLKERGICISVDDFGTGFSSLSYLKHFPVDKLKIDRLFVRELPDNVQDGAIAAAIIGMAHSLGMTVLAEGVETQQQREFLQKLGCDYGQGYLFSQPLASESLAEWFRQYCQSLPVD